MKLASFYSIEEELLKKAMDFDYYKFLLLALIFYSQEVPLFHPELFSRTPKNISKPR